MKSVRRAIVAAALAAAAPAASLQLASAAESAPVSISFFASIPCGPSCPSALDLASRQAACEKTPVAVAMSYDEERLTVPSVVSGKIPTSLIARSAPDDVWDVVACRVVNPGPGERYEYLAHDDCWTCGGVRFVDSKPARLEVPICTHPTMCIQIGSQVLLRAFNVAGDDNIAVAQSWSLAG